MSSTVLLNELLVKSLKSASMCIREGGVVAFPTETYYGLAVDPFNEKALQRLFELKKGLQVSLFLHLSISKSSYPF